MFIPHRTFRSLIPLFVAALAGLAVATWLLGIGVVPFVGLAAVFMLLQWLVAPWLIRRLTHARIVPSNGLFYETAPWTMEYRVGCIVARRCADAGLRKLVRLGIVEDDTPNAFTFGRTRDSAYIFVTTGLVHRLDDAELDAVICHELAHIRHHDAAWMTVLALIPMALYLVARAAVPSADDDDDDGEAVIFAIAMFILYFLSELLLLSFNRSREFAADRWSCECSGNGDALASALVKVTVGAAEADRALKAAMAATATEDRRAEKEVGRVASRRAQLDSVAALGFAKLHNGEPEACSSEPEAARQALIGQLHSRRVRFFEFFSTHPTVARRIVALEQSGLRGAPRRWMLGDAPHGK